MTEKRYSHDAIVIVDHLKEDLIYIDGKDELLELAEYVDRLQEENTTLMKENKQIQVTLSNCMRQIDKLYIGKKLLEQQLLFIDKLINDLGSEEMRRQYNEIIGGVE